MNPMLAQRLAMVTAVAAVGLAVALFVVKSVRWWMRRHHGVRRARYITAVGEIVARGLTPTDLIGWSDDPAFVDVIVEYMEVVAGDERLALEDIIRRTELRRILVERLRSGRNAARLQAAARLAVIADDTVTWVLVEALSDPLPEVRVQAAHGLGVARAVEALPQLVRMLREEEPWVAARVADQIVSFGTSAVPILLETVRDEFQGSTVEPATVEIVARLLGLIGDLRASDTLVALLGHGRAHVRIAAASALGACGTLSAVEPLTSALADADWRVRARAAASLATFSDPSTVAPLAKALEDGSWWVRQHAAETLTETPGGRASLIDALTIGNEDARQASLMYLGLSGAIVQARVRVSNGEGSTEDRRLVDVLDGFGLVGSRAV